VSEPVEPTDAGVRVRLDLAYDGSAFRGWAKQRDARTVQGVLEDALAVVLGPESPAPRLVVAGRTDAGVHARGQVAHLDLAARHVDHLERVGHGDATGALVRKLNGIAGRERDVRVRAARIAPAGFDARFSAVWRRYEYRIADALAERDPLDRAFTVWHPRALDAATMQAAAASLTGLHDWAAYCRPRPGSTTIRDLQAFSWERDARGVLVARLQADAFCHSMVRALVGATVAAGERILDARAPAVLRDARKRTAAFKVMPAAGLTLVEVGYPPDDELAERAARTRGLRSLPDDG